MGLRRNISSVRAGLEPAPTNCLALVPKLLLSSLIRKCRQTEAPSYRHGCRYPASKDGKLGATASFRVVKDVILSLTDVPNIGVSNRPFVKCFWSHIEPAFPSQRGPRIQIVSLKFVQVSQRFYGFIVKNHLPQIDHTGFACIEPQPYAIPVLIACF